MLRKLPVSVRHIFCANSVCNLVGILFKAMPVATVAQAMINDSYKQFTSPGEAGAANNAVILDNPAIYLSAEVT